MLQEIDVEWSWMRRVVEPAYLILHAGRKSVTRIAGSGDRPTMEQLVAATFFDGSVALHTPIHEAGATLGCGAHMQGQELK